MVKTLASAITSSEVYTAVYEWTFRTLGRLQGSLTDRGLRLRPRISGTAGVQIYHCDITRRLSKMD